MTNDKIESDIRYVKSLLKKSTGSSTPNSVYLLWAVLVCTGFSLVDFAPKRVNLFWMIASPAGALLSGWLGRKAGVNKGQMNREIGIRHALHWGGMLVIICLAVLMGIKGLVHGAVVGQVILLIVALGWWTAGVHFDRNFLWLGGIMMLGFAGTLIFDKYAWTVLGFSLGIALTAIAIYEGRKNARRAE